MNVCILTPHLNQGWELHGQNQQKEIKRLCSRRVSALIKSLIKIVDLINFFHQIWMKCLSWPSHIMKTLHVPESRPNITHVTVPELSEAGIKQDSQSKTNSWKHLKAIPKLWHVRLLSVDSRSRSFKHRFLGARGVYKEDVWLCKVMVPRTPSIKWMSAFWPHIWTRGESYMDRTNKKRSKGYVQEGFQPLLNPLLKSLI